jgi:hypothetical protein
VQGGEARSRRSQMKSNQVTYTMPLKQLLKLLETTADDAAYTRRRPRRGPAATPASAVRCPDPDNGR